MSKVSQEHKFPKTFRGKRWQKVIRAERNGGFTQLWVWFGPFEVFFQAGPWMPGESKPGDYVFWNWRLHGFGGHDFMGGGGYTFDVVARQVNRAMDKLVRDLAHGAPKRVRR